MTENNCSMDRDTAGQPFRYSPVCLEHIRDPRNMADVPEHNGFDLYEGPCGDMMTIWLNIENSMVKDVAFQPDGCGVSIDCGSMTTEMARGKTTDELRNITPEMVLAALGGLPQDHAHCAPLAVTTLRMALDDYLGGS